MLGGKYHDVIESVLNMKGEKTGCGGDVLSDEVCCIYDTYRKKRWRDWKLGVEGSTVHEGDG